MGRAGRGAAGRVRRARAVALGGAITADNAPRLRCDVVCGSANNQLADEALADVLAEHGVLYAPDFIANAGGLIHVYMEIKGYSEARAIALAEGIGDPRGHPRARGQPRVSPLAAARDAARERLDAALRN